MLMPKWRRRGRCCRSGDGETEANDAADAVETEKEKVGNKKSVNGTFCKACKLKRSPKVHDVEFANNETEMAFLRRSTKNTKRERMCKEEASSARILK